MSDYADDIDTMLVFVSVVDRYFLIQPTHSHALLGGFILCCSDDVRRPVLPIVSAGQHEHD